MSDRDDAATGPNGDSADRDPSDRESPLEGLTDRITDDRRATAGEGDESASDVADSDVAGDGEQTERPSPRESRESPAGEGGAPLDRIVGDVRERRQRRERGQSDPFEEMDVEAVAGEGVWEDLLSEEDVGESECAVGAGASAVEAGTAGLDDREEHVVPKAEFCGRCPHLGEPPELACENDGTEIIEVTDSEHFRVRGCPFAGQGEDDLTEFD